MNRILNHFSHCIFVVCALCSTGAQAQAVTTPVASAANQATPTSSALDAPLFYQLLIGEISVRGEQSGEGFSLILDAARKTNDARLYERAVDIAIQSRSGDAALQAARAWKTAQPNSREANRSYLQILVALNRISESLESLKLEVQMAPPDQKSSVIAQIPRLFARAGDKKAAATVIEQALADATSPKNVAAAAWVAIGRARLAAANVSGALIAAKNAQEADIGSEGAAFLAVEIMEPKQALAETIVKSYLSSPKPLAEIRMGYARALIDVQRYAEASTQIEAVTREKPELAEAWLILGSLKVQDNQLDAADAALKRFISLAAEQGRSEERARGLTQAYLSLSQIAEKRKDFPLAESWLAKIDSQQDLASTQTRRASMLAKQGKLAEARALISKLPERDAADKRMKLMAEVQLLRDNKAYQAAYDLLAQAYAKTPEDPDLLYDQAMMAEKLRRLPEMESLLRKLIASKPDYHHAYNALGYSFAERQIRLPEAKELIQKALTYAPGDPFITDSLGWVEFRLGNKSLAKQLLQTAYSARPDAEIGAHLGEVLWSLGEREQALKIWKEATLLNPENDTLLETLKRLRVSL